MSKYTCAIIFTKKTDLIDYLYTNKVLNRKLSGVVSDGYERQCAEKRDIQLILLTRNEGNKLMCRIRCPINPLPVKGEFEAPRLSVIEKFLFENGWRFKQKIYPHMLE